MFCYIKRYFLYNVSCLSLLAFRVFEWTNIKSLIVTLVNKSWLRVKWDALLTKFKEVGSYDFGLWSIASELKHNDFCVLRDQGIVIDDLDTVSDADQTTFAKVVGFLQKLYCPRIIVVRSTVQSVVQPSVQKYAN